MEAVIKDCIFICLLALVVIAVSLLGLKYPVVENALMLDLTKPITINLVKSYTAILIHKDISHLFWNMVCYFFIMTMIYTLFKLSKKRNMFYRTCFMGLLIVPLVTGLVDTGSYPVLKNYYYFEKVVGFSGVISYFLGLFPLGYLYYLKSFRLKFRPELLLFFFLSATLFTTMLVWWNNYPFKDYKVLFVTLLISFVFSILTFICSKVYVKENRSRMKLNREAGCLKYLLIIITPFLYFILVINLYPLSNDGTHFFSHFVGLLSGVILSPYIVKSL